MSRTLSLVDKIQQAKVCQQHCSHYVITEKEESYEWEKDDWCISNFQFMSFDNLCNESDVIKYIDDNVKCTTCHNELMSFIHKLPTNFYEFDILDTRTKLVSENTLTFHNINFNLEYLFTNFNAATTSTSEDQWNQWIPIEIDYSTNVYKLKLIELFGTLHQLLEQPVSEENMLLQDQTLFDMIQVLITYICVIQKFANVSIFETVPPIELHSKYWKLLDLMFSMMFKHSFVFTTELSEFLKLLGIPLTPLFNIHTKEYFEDFKRQCGDDADSIHVVLTLKKKINETRLSDIESFFRCTEKHLQKYENDFVSFMKRTCNFHDTEEYLSTLHMSGERSILFVMFELLFGPLLNKRVDKIPTYQQELQCSDLRACQIVTSHMSSYTKHRDLLYKIAIPKNFPLIPEYHKEICDTIRKLDAEWNSYETECSRQIKYEESLARTNHRPVNEFSKRILECITTLKCITVLRKLGTFIHFLNDARYVLEGLVCGIVPYQNVYDYLSIIKKQIQFKELNRRCLVNVNERLLNELLTEESSASVETKKKSKKKTTKKKEKNMNSPQDPVPDNIEWISKVNPSSSFTSLVTLCEESSTITNSSSDDDKQWTHVTNQKASKSKQKEIRQQPQNTNVQKQKNTNKKQNAPPPSQTTSTTTASSSPAITTTATVKSGVSFAEILRRKQETPNIPAPVSENTDVVLEVNDADNIPVVVESIPTTTSSEPVVVPEDVPVVVEPTVVPPKKKKNKKATTTTTLSPPPPPQPLFPPPLPTGRGLTTERYLTRIPDYIHIPSYNAEQFYIPQINADAPVIPQQTQQQIVLVPQVIYVPQMYSTPYHVMYPTMY